MDGSRTTMCIGSMQHNHTCGPFKSPTKRKAMKAGIYHVKFRSNQQSHGEGLAVIKDGSINGGDQGYLYLGSFKVDGVNVSAKVKVKKWSNALTSVFGNLADFDLDLRGSFTADFGAFSITGSMIQMPTMRITIEGRRVSDAT